MSVQNKRILVTGAHGFIGRHLCQALRQGGAYVVGCGRNADKRNIYASKLYELNIVDKSCVQDIVKSVRPDFVVHLAATKNNGIDFSAYWDAYETNLVGSLNLIEACDALNPFTRFIFLGSADEYGVTRAPYVETAREAPVNAYGISKLAVTQLLQSRWRTKAFPAVILRPTIVYGPGQRANMFLPAIIEALVRGEEFEMTTGLQTRDLVYIDDLIHAILLAMETPKIEGKVINISSARPTQIIELARMTAKIIDEKAESLLRVGAKSGRQGEAMNYWAKNGLAEELLGWLPKVSLEQGLRRTVEYFCASR